jgi:hypothetical protein
VDAHSSNRVTAYGDEPSTKCLTSGVLVDTTSHMISNEDIISAPAGRTEIDFIVDLLKYGTSLPPFIVLTSRWSRSFDAKDIQLRGLTGVKLITQERASQNSAGISELLDLEYNSNDAFELALRSALILSQMVKNRHSCTKIVAAGALRLLSRLLSQPLSHETLMSIVEAMTQCAVHHRWYKEGLNALFTFEVCLPLLKLIYSGETEVQIAVASTIEALVINRDCDLRQRMFNHHVLRQLCHLCSKCTDLSSLEKLASAIGRIMDDGDGLPDEDIHDDCEDIKHHVLETLVDFLRHGSQEAQVGASRALRKLAHSCIVVSECSPVTVLPYLHPLLLSEDDEVFVEAMYATLRWRDNIEYIRSQPCLEWANIPVVPRLICLLSCSQTQVAVCAARVIAKMVSKSQRRNFPPDIQKYVVNEVITYNGAPLLVSMLSSGSDLAQAAAHALEHLCQIRRRDFVAHGVIPALVKKLAPSPDSPNDLLASLKAMIWGFDLRGDEGDTGLHEDFIYAGVIHHLIRLLAECLDSGHEIYENYQIFESLSNLVYSSQDAQNHFLSAGGVQPFMQTMITFRYTQAKWIYIIIKLAGNSNEAHVQFQAAGVENVLRNYLAGNNIDALTRNAIDVALSLFCPNANGPSPTQA